MDQTDLKIINILQEDGRCSIKTIGAKVNLSSPAVSERLRRLEEQGIIEGYCANINYLKLNKTIAAFITVDVDPQKYDGFCEFCKKNPLIKEHYHIIGPHNAMLHAVVSDSNELADLLSKIQIFGVSQTSVILNTLFNRKANI